MQTLGGKVRGSCGGGAQAPARSPGAAPLESQHPEKGPVSILFRKKVKGTSLASPESPLPLPCRPVPPQEARHLRARPPFLAPHEHVEGGGFKCGPEGVPIHPAPREALPHSDEAGLPREQSRGPPRLAEGEARAEP